MTTDQQSIRQRCLARYLLLNNRKETTLIKLLAQYQVVKGQKALDTLQTFIDLEKANFRGWCALHGFQPIWKNYCYYYAQTMPVKEALQ